MSRENYELARNACVAAVTLVVQAIDSERPIEYQHAVKRLLLGTAAVESDFILQRQGGFPWDYSYKDKIDSMKVLGAWSFWQLEHCSVQDSLVWLFTSERGKETLKKFACLYGPMFFLPAAFPGMSTVSAMTTIAVSPTLAALFARIHYLRDKHSIPTSQDPAELGAYWKRVYNTEMGAGTVSRFVQAYKENNVEGLLAQTL